ncbi:MAG: TetR/AcrR family transcriptional regulator [Xanthomonadaceae bacterium]|nr:TetR/AcrR family transcriptional regulator [Xanthomonadaceae bacterium]MDE1964738.1 TetR/AcrR family transcriptional regulator [Xanthomonadaceae bacterium]
MTPVSSERPPQQARSRRTHVRLLMATLKMLSEHGLDGTTIPRIAREAGVSPATVYRRFQDKQALLRAACLHFLDMGNQANHLHLQRKLGKGTLESSAREMVGLMFTQNRMQPKLMQAMEKFLGDDDDDAFVQEALAIRDDNLDQVIQAMLAHRDEITHSDPEQAVRIATLQAATSIGILCFEPRSPWRTVHSLQDDVVADELARAYVAYLRRGD